jgi:broad specificity phosphatase PhoE
VKLILVRHGETMWNRENRVQGFTDVALSDLGRLQAERLGLCLRDEPLDAVHCSTLQRAYDTASAIARHHDLPILTDPDLRELNQGDFEGLTFAELRDRYRAFLKQWITDPGSVTMPNGESLQGVQDRAWQAIRGIVAEDRDALVVSHGFTIMSILCRIQGIELNEFRRAQIDLASRTHVEFAGGKGTVVLFNDTTHLKDLCPPVR